MDSNDADKMNNEEELNNLKQYIADFKNKVEERKKIRDSNNIVTWPSEDYFTNHDTSLKKNTTFVKKLRQFTSQNIDALLKGKYYRISI